MTTLPEPPAHAPRTLDDLDRVIDLFVYESVSGAYPNLEVGGKGAYCYYGPAECARLAGTELESWVDRFREYISKDAPDDEDFCVEFEGRYWRASRNLSDRGAQLSIRRLASDCPHLNDLRFGESPIRDLLMAPWLNDGGLVVFCGLTGQGKTTAAAATIRSRLEIYGGRMVSVEDAGETRLEGLWGKGSGRQLRVDYRAADPIKRGFAWTIRQAYRSQPATRPAILFIGEVRDQEVAVEVVKAAANGMLVVTTVHSFDTSSAIQRIAGLAETALGEVANQALSQALRLVVHLSLNLKPDMVGWRRGSFTPTVLLSTGGSHPLANHIRKSSWAGIANVQEMQQIRMNRAAERGTSADELINQLSNLQS